MAETGAIFGGEHSAHYYFRDNWRADSGSIAALFVLEQLCLSGQKLSELRKPFERYAQSGEINSRVADPLATIEVVAAAFAALMAAHSVSGITTVGWATAFFRTVDALDVRVITIKSALSGYLVAVTCYHLEIGRAHV